MFRFTDVQIGSLNMAEQNEKNVNMERVSMNIALSPEKKFLKVYVAEHDTTVAAVIAKCVKR